MWIEYTIPLTKPTIVDGETLRQHCPTVAAFLDDPYVTELTIRSVSHAFMPIIYRKLDTPEGRMYDRRREETFKGELAAKMARLALQ